MALEKNVTNAAIRDALISMGVIQQDQWQQVDLSGAQNGFFKNGLATNHGITQDQFNAAKTLARWDGDAGDQGAIMKDLGKAGIALNTSADAQAIFQRKQQVTSGQSLSVNLPGAPGPAAATAPAGGFAPSATPSATSGIAPYSSGNIRPQPPAAAGAATKTPITPAQIIPGKGGDAGGAGVTAPAQPYVAPPKTPADVNAFIQKQFGYMGSLMSVPEIADLIKNLAGKNASDEDVIAEFESTKWFQNTSDTQKGWQLLPPGEQNKRIDGQVRTLKQTALQFGLNLDDDKAKEIATTGLSQGWDPIQFNQALGSEYHYQSGQTPITGVTQQLKNIQNDWLVPLTDSQIQQWGQDIISGKNTTDGFTDYNRQLSKSMFPGLSAAIDKGQTTKTLVAPYQNLAAQTLEIDPSQVDFMNPKYQKMLSNTDPKTGQPALMGLSDAQTYLRGLPEWATTKQANQAASQLGQKLMQSFGAVA